MASRRPSKPPAADRPPAYRTVLPKTSLTKDIPEEDSEDDNPSRESRFRRQKPQPTSSRRGYGSDDSDEPPARDSRAGKQKATAKSSNRDDRRGRYDSGDDDRYGGSRRDSGNRARDQIESRNWSPSRSRSRSRSRNRSRHRDRASTTALARRGESSRALNKGDGRSRADTKKGKGNNRAKHSHSDEEEEEEDIKIARYIAIDIDELEHYQVEVLCKLLDVRAGKVKQWCERELIRRDITTGLIDMKRLVAEVDEEDARLLRRFIEKLEAENKTAKIYGGHEQHHGRDHSHHGHDHHYHEVQHMHRRRAESPNFESPISAKSVMAGCEHCSAIGRLCKYHVHLADVLSWT